MNKMKKILMVAYYFPPKGGAGVQRTVKFANYLAKFGYEVHVLTVNEDTSGIKDVSGLKEVDSRVIVHRTDIKEHTLLEKLVSSGSKSSSSAKKVVNTPAAKPSLVSKMKSGLRSAAKKVFLDVYNLAYIPDDKSGWIDYAVEEGLKIIKDNSIDYIYTTSGPYTAHIIGLKIVKKADVKWVADFRDPWASNPFVNYSMAVKNIYKRLERKVIKRADYVLTVSQPIVDDFILRYKDEKKEKFTVITNGYDEENFTDLNLKLGESNERFTILYNGTLYGRRSPEKILEAISRLINDKKIEASKIKIRFIGQIGNEHMGTVRTYMNALPDVVEHKDYLPHSESLKELCTANALLLIIDEGKGAEGILTGKIFEYIRCGKPIIGVVPQGAAKDLIIDTQTGYTAKPSSVDEISDIILKAYTEYFTGNNGFKPNWEKIRQYSRENLTKHLMDVLEN